MNGCLMAIFLAIAENSKLKFINSECNAVGIVEKINMKLAATEITPKPKIVIESTEHEDQLKKILEMSKRECLIINAVPTKINLEPIIEVP